MSLQCPHPKLAGLFQVIRSSHLFILSLYIPNSNTSGNCLPFGEEAGDLEIATTVDGASPAIAKMDPFNLTCPYFGEDQDVLFVRYNSIKVTG